MVVYESVILDPDNNRVELVAIMDYYISKATPVDLERILYLQKCCYLSEAEIYNNYSIPPLTQTMDGIKNDFENQTIFKFEYKGKILGSVRAFLQHDTCHIGRLFVDKEFQNKGIGKLLLGSVENNFNQVNRFELFTGNKSEKNLYLYKKNGYNEFKEELVNDVHIIYLEKHVRQ